MRTASTRIHIVISNIAPIWKACSVQKFEPTQPRSSAAMVSVDTA